MGANYYAIDNNCIFIISSRLTNTQLNPLILATLPKVSGLIVPIMNPMNHVGNNRLFEPLVLLTHKHDNDSDNHEDANREEEPENHWAIMGCVR